MEEYTNYLVHHGVKGMKWGVRHEPDITKKTNTEARDKKQYLKNHKRAIKTGLAIVGGVLTVYGVKKLSYSLKYRTVGKLITKDLIKEADRKSVLSARSYVQGDIRMYKKLGDPLSSEQILNRYRGYKKDYFSSYTKNLKTEAKKKTEEAMRVYKSDKKRKLSLRFNKYARAFDRGRIPTGYDKYLYK